MKKLIILSLIIIAAFGGVVKTGDFAFKWKSSSLFPNGTVIQACSGDNVTFPWVFDMTSSKQFAILWSKTSKTKPDQEKGLILAAYREHFQGLFPERELEFVPNAGIMLPNVTLADTGFYKVYIILRGHSEVYEQVVLLHVCDVPVITSNEVYAFILPESACNSTTGLWHVQLGCRPPLIQGQSALPVIWNTPSNQTVISTYYNNYTFILQLPLPVEDGDYSCSLNRSVPVVKCLSTQLNTSRAATVNVKGVNTRLSYLEGSKTTLWNETVISNSYLCHLTDTFQQLQTKSKKCCEEIINLNKTTENINSALQKLQIQNENMTSKINRLESITTTAQIKYDNKSVIVLSRLDNLTDVVQRNNDSITVLVQRNNDSMTSIVQSTFKDITAMVQRNNDSMTAIVQSKFEDITATVQRNNDSMTAIVQRKFEDITATLQRNNDSMTAMVQSKFEDITATVQRNNDSMTAIVQSKFEDITATVQRNNDSMTAMVQSKFEDITATVQRNNDSMTAMIQRKSEDITATVQRNNESMTAIVQRKYEDITATVQRNNDSMTAIVQSKFEDITATVQRNNDSMTAMIQSKFEDITATVQRNNDSMTALVQRNNDSMTAMVQRNNDSMTAIVQSKFEDITAMVQRNNDSMTAMVQSKFEDITATVQRNNDSMTALVQRNNDSMTAMVQRNNDSMTAIVQSKFEDITTMVQRNNDSMTAMVQRNNDSMTAIVQSKFEDITATVQRYNDSMTAMVQSNNDSMTAMVQSKFEDITTMVQRNNNSMTAMVQSKFEDITAMVQGNNNSITVLVQKNNNMTAMVQSKFQDITAMVLSKFQDMTAKVERNNNMTAMVQSKFEDITAMVQSKFQDMTAMVQSKVDGIITMVQRNNDNITATFHNITAIVLQLQSGLSKPINVDNVQPPASCVDVQKYDKVSGVHTLNVSNKSIKVYCDQSTDNGGWTVIQRRQDGSVDFYRNWEEYEKGFGDPNGEFWIGLANLHLLTKTKTVKLRVDLKDHKDATAYAVYNMFAISGADDKYRLKYGGYSGTAGDGLNGHNKTQFSTYDRDNDAASDFSCAVVHRGAWWYRSCAISNLNGLYKPKDFHDPKGISWSSWKSDLTYLKRVEMKIKE